MARHEQYGRQAGYDPQSTQQWQGQTWETQTHAPVQSAETAYLPPLQEQQPYQQPQQAQPYAEPYAESYGPQAQQQHYAPQSAPAPEAATPEPAEASGPAYGPATLGGNARITDAQRARLEGRSPIIDPGMQPAALTALLACCWRSRPPPGPGPCWFRWCCSRPSRRRAGSG